MTEVQDLIDYTNHRIEKWYELAKTDYNVEGKGEARIEGDAFIIDYVENGVKKTWSWAFYPEYLEDREIDFYYNAWAEQG